MIRLLLDLNINLRNIVMILILMFIRFWKCNLYYKTEILMGKVIIYGITDGTTLIMFILFTGFAIYLSQFTYIHYFSILKIY